MDYSIAIGGHIARNMGKRSIIREEDFHRLGSKPAFPPKVWTDARGIFARKD